MSIFSWFWGTLLFFTSNMQNDYHADPDQEFSRARIFGQVLDVLFEKAHNYTIPIKPTS